MAKNKRTQQAQADIEEANLGQKTTGLEGVTPKKKSANGGYGSGSGSSNNYGLGSNESSGSNNSGNLNVGSGSETTVDAINNQARNKYHQRFLEAKKQVDEVNKANSNARNFDYPRGKTKDGYNSLETVGHEVNMAKREVKEKEGENELLQAAWKNKTLLESHKKGIEKAIKQAEKAGYDPKTGAIKMLKGKLAQVQEDIAYYDKILETEDGTGKYSGDPNFNKDFKKSVEGIRNDLVKQSNTIMKQIDAGESYDKAMTDALDWAKNLGTSIGVDIDDFEKWVVENGDKVNKFQLEALQNISSELNHIMEDGVVDKDEVKNLGSVVDLFGKLADETRLADKDIQNADDKLRSAEAKKRYFLFDQIKTWAVLLIGLSSGNAQMVYSALDNYNKKIADAEADYKAGEIKAFENNNVKDITGEADALYDIAQIKSVLEQKIAESNLSEADKAKAVKQLKNALDTYRPYAKSDKDFAAWFTTQNAQNANSAWGMLMNVLSGAAMNADALREIINGSGDNKKTLPGGGHGSLDKKQASGLGSGILESIIENALSSAKTAENAKEQSRPINAARDKQALLASMKGQLSGAPQAGGTAAPVNKSWGA